MKHTSPCTLIIAFLSIVLLSSAQVTKLSNNTNIKAELINGIGLGGVGVMYDDKGSLWKTDGTPEGTSKYTNKVVLDSPEAILQTPVNNKVYFAGVSPADGSELWVTDGTDAGTAVVMDINPGAPGSSPSDFILFNNVIYFFATTPASGRELWRSDGTNPGTFMVKDINPKGDGYPGYTSFIICNNILFFLADDGTHGIELWKTDGTETGTVMVADINPNGYSFIEYFAALGTDIFFSADDGIHGEELWKSDGSPGGTVLVKDIASGNESSFPSDFLLFNGKLFFVAGFPGYYGPLWSTDGSEEGTSMVFDWGSFSSASLWNAVIFGKKFLFNVHHKVSGSEIWISDGTPGGTDGLKDFLQGSSYGYLYIWPDIYGSILSGAANWHNRLFNGKIFIDAVTVNDSGTSTNLWITDGTIDNTVLVKALPRDSSFEFAGGVSWFYTQSGVYFAASDGTHGIELWKSDGTGNGTAMVKDINPNGSSFSGFVMFFNGHIYFTADDGDNSNGDVDLYVIDEAVTLPVTLLDFTAALNGKAAQLQWTTSAEINTKNFIVQRSTDGVHFQNIGSINAVGSVTQKTSYQFADAGALNAGSNKLYYRLQMKDGDGKFTYSKIAMINITNNKLFVMSPNPVKNDLLITSGVLLNNVQMRISDQNGKVVYLQQIKNMQAGSPNKINVSNLNKGIYYLQLVTGSDVQTIKFFKY